jgi:hypothetical protein
MYKPFRAVCPPDITETVPTIDVPRVVFLNWNVAEPGTGPARVIPSQAYV